MASRGNTCGSRHFVLGPAGLAFSDPTWIGHGSRHGRTSASGRQHVVSGAVELSARRLERLVSLRVPQAGLGRRIIAMDTAASGGLVCLSPIIKTSS